MTARLAAISRHLAGAAAADAGPQEGAGSAANGPLHGFRVLDLSQMVSGPMGTQILADMGADVIKVEPLAGAAERGASKDRIVSPLFALVNRNKRSLCIDLKKPHGLEAFFKLVPTADVVVQNFRPGVAERMGIGYEDVKRVNPRVVYMSISGFGRTGPYANKRVYDPVVQAVSGLASVQADETGRPRMMRLIIPDKVTALTSAQAVTAALLMRSRTGRGTHVELSMLDSVLSFSWAEAFAQETFVDGQTRDYTYARDMVFATRDGYITCGAVQDKEWRALCTALDRPQWIDDPRFKTAAARALNRGERFQMTEDVLKTMTTADAVARLTKHQVPNAVINHPRTNVLTDPQVVTNKLIAVVDHPWAAHPMRQPRPAARFSGAPFELRRHAPLLGEHNRELLSEVGVDADALAAEGAARVVKGRKPSARARDGRLYDPVSG